MLSNVLPLATCSYLKLNLTNLELSLSDMLAIFQVLNNQMWLVATLLNNADREHLHHCKSSPGQHCSRRLVLTTWTGFEKDRLLDMVAKEVT